MFHRRAGRYLENVAPSELANIAEHCLRGSEPLRAALFYRRAAEAALSAGEPVLALAHIESGLRCGPIGELLGALQELRARCPTG